MMQIQDLNIRKDILPLFDYTINDHAAAVILQLMQQVPESVDEVYNRQHIIKGFLHNWPIIKDFSYQRLDFKEALTFLDDIATRHLVLERRKLKATLQLSFSEENRRRLQSSMVQLTLLLHTLHTRYFSRLDISAFPDDFQKRSSAIISFFNKLNLETNASLIRENKFSVSAMVNFGQILNSLSKEEVKSFREDLSLFEAYFSIAKGVLKYKLTFPVFKSTAFVLEDFYHPALTNPVKNSLASCAENVVLLTGPNMSGKSTLLRAIGLCVYLAHVGLAVPASKCELPFFDTIAIVLNANDNLRSGYSHFMSEIQHLKAVVEQAHAGKKCFAVFDEIFRGTNIDDALEITRTTVNGLCKYSHSYFFISTHLLQLKDDLNPNGIGKYNIACELQDSYPQFYYKLREGWSDLKIGKILFEKEGLSELLMR